MNEKVERLIEFFKCFGKWGARGLYAAIAKKTAFTPAYVGQVFKGVKKEPADKFIIAVCKAFDFDKEWILSGDTVSGWRVKVSEKFFEETGERAAPEDIESGNVDHQRPNIASLLRLHSMLTDKGILERGRVAALSDATGLTQSETAGILTGTFHLTDAFLQKVCAKFGFNKAWIELGNDLMVTAGDVSMTMKDYENRMRKAGGMLGAPTQEIVNDMKRLTESNRWVFVGKVKPIIQAMIEEQEANTIN